MPAISSLSQVTWSNMQDGQPLPAGTLNSGFNNINSLGNSLITVAGDLENNYASASAPTDKPAGKHWYDTNNSAMKYYETTGGTLRTTATVDGTQTLTNKTLTSPILASPAFTGAVVGSEIFTGAAAISAPASGKAAIAALSTNGFGVAKSALYTMNEAGARWEFGGSANKNNAASGVSIAESYVSGTGTAGSAGVAGAVKSVTIPANSLSGVGQALRITYLCAPNDAAGTLSYFLTLNGVTIGSSLAFPTNTNGQWGTVTIYYVDSTHANSIGEGTNASGNLSRASGGINTAGFDWTSAQTLSAAQTSVGGKLMTVYLLYVEQLG